MSNTQRTATHLVLVPGFWLGAWAWEAVAADLAGRGYRVTTVTLPGLDSAENDRAAITLDDHVQAILDAAATTPAEERTVLVAHSGAGPVSYAATDRAPDRFTRVIYVDSGPLQNGSVLREDLDPSATEIPLPTWAELEAEGSSLEGLDDAALAGFRARAVPHPAGPARDVFVLKNERRLDVPSTVLCTSFPSDTIRQMAASGHPMVAELAHLRTVDYVDLPTGHWPMWSRPAELADVIDAAAAR
ncbi:MAG: alpha/beta fold hydrolase [Rhodococcus sp. (in: high G+C Gram-positive bacteria)]|uniref:alpha/beta fold hydrolase n=1 Tax=Rhodococcus sp. TaxID=1831 RepID=UPI003BB0E311